MTHEREKRGCKARQYSDQMICDACGLQWDMNDEDPPECDPHPALPRTRGKRAIRQLIEELQK